MRAKRLWIDGSKKNNHRFRQERKRKHCREAEAFFLKFKKEEFDLQTLNLILLFLKWRKISFSQDWSRDFLPSYISIFFLIDRCKQLKGENEEKKPLLSPLSIFFRIFYILLVVLVTETTEDLLAKSLRSWTRRISNFP